MNSKNTKYILRKPPSGPAKICYPFSGNPAQYDDTLTTIAGVNGYRLWRGK